MGMGQARIEKTLLMKLRRPLMTRDQGHGVGGLRAGLLPDFFDEQDDECERRRAEGDECYGP